MHATSPSHPPFIDNFNNSWWWPHITKLLNMQFSEVSYYFIPFMFKYSLLQNSSICSFQVSYYCSNILLSIKFSSPSVYVLLISKFRTCSSLLLMCGVSCYRPPNSYLLTIHNYICISFVSHNTCSKSALPLKHSIKSSQTLSISWQFILSLVENNDLWVSECCFFSLVGINSSKITYKHGNLYSFTFIQGDSLC